MKNRIITLIGMIFWAGFASCIEEFRLPTEEISSIVVIEGMITDGLVEIEISRTVNSNVISRPVPGATVRVVDQRGESLLLRESEDGHYSIDPALLDIAPGKWYSLEATLPSGQVYRSIPDTVPAGISADELSWNRGRNRGRNTLQIWTAPTIPEVEGGMRGMWRITDAYVQTPTNFPDPFNSVPQNCFVEYQPDNQSITLLDASAFMGKKMDPLLTGFIFIDGTFDEKHVISVEQFSLSRDAYAFWERAARLLAQNGSLFDPPPAILPGNIYQVGDPDIPTRGYVAVGLYQVERFAIYPTDFPQLQLPDPCTYSANATSYPRGCIRCLDLPNSSSQMPWYFDQVR